MSMSRMTGKERLEAALRFQSVDRIPWAPKVFVGHYRSGTSSTFQNMTIREFAREIHADAIGWDRLIQEKPDSTVTVEKNTDGCDTCMITRTPAGELRRVTSYSPETRTSHIKEFPLKTPEDYDTMAYVIEHTTFDVVPDVHRETLESVGDQGIVVTRMRGTPIMLLVQFEAGIPHLYYHLQDFPEKVRMLYDMMAEKSIQQYERLINTDAKYICTEENTSLSLISPDIYEEFVLPLKQRINRMVKAAGKYHILHMCGTLKGLLGQINQVGADCWESFTPPPIGDTHFADGRAVNPTMVLAGGMNAAMLTQWEEKDIYNYVQSTLEGLADSRGLIFTSGGAMPIECPLERLIRIGKAMSNFSLREK